MSISTLREIYRIDVGPSACRSVGALVTLNALEIGGVEAVALGRDDTLLLMAASDFDLHDDIVRAVVKSGLHPESVTVSDVERAADTLALSIEEAERLGMIRAPKEPVRATVETVQRVSVSVTDGYDPETIVVEAGLPSEIRFSEGHGCLGMVVFDALNIEADLEDGGALVVLPSLEPGIYGFRCGRDMVHGTLIAE